MRKLGSGRLLFEAQIIPHHHQSYETCGDWQFDGEGVLHLRASDMGNDDYAFAILIHEMIEAWPCRKHGVDEQAVTDFDIAFEAARLPGNEDEPGDDPRAPYAREHATATMIEKILIQKLGLDWPEYNAKVNSLSLGPRK